MSIHVQQLIDDSIHAYAALTRLGKERMAELDQALIPRISYEKDP